ncbi:hypothetical protein FRC00_007232 [Tulasnella sp. 408]|nr:hypothetical protein FRC00_007232 [Tulasnella sp. 408]
MRLKKTHPTLDSISAPSSAPSTTVPLPPNTLRKPKPPPADALPPKEDPSASSPRQPSTLKKASPAIAMVGPSSIRSSSSSSSSSSTTTTAEAEVVSLNDDPDLKPEAPPSSSPTKLSQFTFRGWPVSRKPPSTFSPPPSRDGRSSSTHGNYWSSVAPTNPQSQALTPSSSAASASSDASTSPSLPWSSADMYRASSGASTSSSVYSVKVTAPTVPAIHHPFIPKRPYSAPVTSPPPPLSDSLPSSPLLIGEHPRRRSTANGRILYQTIPEGSPATEEVSAATRPPEISVTPHGISSPAPSSSPLPSRTSPSSDQGYAADNDGDSVGSDRSVIQAVTVVNELDKYSLHINA